MLCAKIFRCKIYNIYYATFDKGGGIWYNTGMLLEDYRNERLRKLEEIRARGIDPYPAKSLRNTKSQLCDNL